VNKYSISKISSESAGHFWINSPQSSVFTHPKVLDELAKEVHWWAVTKGQETQCIWPVTLNAKRKPFIPPFSYWQGPMWTKKAYNHPSHKTLSLKTAVYELFIETFIDNYGSIKASLHPSILDVRVFDWWNYTNSEKPKFSIKPRYTAIIGDLQVNSKPIEKSYRSNRRRELIKFKKINELVFFNSSCSEEELILFYCDTLKINRSQIEKSLISLLKVVKSGFGWIQTTRKKCDSSLCGLILILSDEDQANLVLNLATTEFRDKGLMAGSITKALKTTQKKGLCCFDFNGANSPFRGDDKHSYGAKPILYFDLEYNIKISDSLLK
jgi:hypothetical protein